MQIWAGLFTTLVEMAIGGKTGINISLDSICRSTDTAEVISALFNEECKLLLRT